MAITASWHGQRWEISHKQLIAVDSLSTGKEIQIDSEDGVQKVTGVNPQKVSISTNLYRTAGVNVRSAVEKWYSLVGATAPLYVGTRRFGPKTLKLQSVSVSDITLRDDGEMLSCALSLSFVEWGIKVASKTKKTSQKKAKKI